mmetsp:Transcript_21891/g.63694  ORF Transcript_21891/g.63694 Transcript_21891/m.63694 type:complete len:367 (-) Transcript_21891:152-1252(-)
MGNRVLLCGLNAGALVARFTRTLKRVHPELKRLLCPGRSPLFFFLLLVTGSTTIPRQGEPASACRHGEERLRTDGRKSHSVHGMARTGHRKPHGLCAGRQLIDNHLCIVASCRQEPSQRVGVETDALVRCHLSRIACQWLPASPEIPTHDVGLVRLAPTAAPGENESAVRRCYKLRDAAQRNATMLAAAEVHRRLRGRQVVRHDRAIVAARDYQFGRVRSGSESRDDAPLATSRLACGAGLQCLHCAPRLRNVKNSYAAVVSTDQAVPGRRESKGESRSDLIQVVKGSVGGPQCPIEGVPEMDRMVPTRRSKYARRWIGRVHPWVPGEVIDRFTFGGGEDGSPVRLRLGPHRSRLEDPEHVGFIRN